MLEPVLPVAWPAVRVCDGKYRDGVRGIVVNNLEGKLVKQEAPGVFEITRPAFRRLPDFFHRSVELGFELDRRPWTAFPIPTQRRQIFCLGFWMELNRGFGH